MDIQLAPNAMQPEKGVDVTAHMGGKLMHNLLRLNPHKVILADDLHLKAVTDANVATHRDKLCKTMKDATKDDKGWFEPLPDFFKDNREEILRSKDV
jgi:hypothetical protein